MRLTFVQMVLSVFVALAPLPVEGQKLDRAVLAFGSTGPNLTTFWLAREAGLYKQYGLDVDVVFFRGSTIAINALATKDAHFGAFGASSSVLARLGGLDTVLIATATPGLLFYLVTKKEIKNAADMKGKKIGASRPGTDSDLAARVAVQQARTGGKGCRDFADGHGRRAIVGDGSRRDRRHGGDHRRLRGGAKARLPLDLGSLPSEHSLRSGVDDHHALADQGKSGTGGRFVRGFVAAIQYAQTHRDVTLKVLSKYMRTTDADILNASYDYYVGRVIPRVPYVSEKGLQGGDRFHSPAQSAGRQRQTSGCHGQPVYQGIGRKRVYQEFI